MHRFFVTAKLHEATTFAVEDPEQVHHIKDVLRLKAGTAAVLFDGQGSEYDCLFEGATESQALFAVKQKRASRRVVPAITVACAIPKHAKMDDIVDKLTQLGVSRIIPLLTERVIVRLDAQKSALRQKRWNKIALAAAKQSQRNTVTTVDPVTDLARLIERSGSFGLKLIPHLGSGCRDLRSVIEKHRPDNVLVLIGPEGDFSPEEVAAAVKAGFVPVTFGDFVLRVETACLYAASVLRYAFAP